MKNILVICFFPAFSPPSSGGEQRLLHFYTALSSHFKITLLTSTDFEARFEQIQHTENLVEIRFPKDDLWRNAYKTLERTGVTGDLSGLAFALAVSDPACKLRRKACDLADRADYIVHEFPFSEPIFSDGTQAYKEIYNAHNFEASLLNSIVRGDGFADVFLKLVRVERNLVRRAARVYATSDIDSEKFRLFYGARRDQLDICPNGWDPVDAGPSLPQPDRARPRVLFFGSAHYPNVEAAEYMLRLAELVPGCDFVIAGGVAKAIEVHQRQSNVLVAGPFENETKLQLLRSADIFINPVTLGSGTSLKALEALGSGLPLLSTPEGVRGLGLVDGEHALIVPRDDFAGALQALLADPARRQSLSSAARAFVESRFTWRAIADQFAAGLEAPRPSDPPEERPCILAFNDYPVLDLTWGGKARIRNLLRNLDADVVLVSFGAICDAVLLEPGFLHIVVPKTREHQAFEQALNAGQPVSVNDLAASLFVTANQIMAELSAELAIKAHLLIFEHCYMAPLLDVICKVRPTIPVVYSAHNVEADHRTAMLGAHSVGSTLSDYARALEGHLLEAADLVVCCTGSDRDRFAAAGAASLVIPNGCMIPDLVLLEKKRQRGHPASLRAGFMGSGHGPNVEAAMFIVGELAPAFPDVIFEFIGDVCGALPLDIPPNVELRGVLGEAAKSQMLASWNIALNPLEAGGGSSLKLPDYLAHGLPVLTTPIGARGVDISAFDGGKIAELSDFVAAFAGMIVDIAGLETQGHNARLHAERHLSWRSLAGPYRQFFSDTAHLHDAGLPDDRKSLLIVTYRYTEPSLGGAETYLVEVMKRLRSRFKVIDLAAIDVGPLTNHHHFGCKWSDANRGASTRLGALFDRALFFRPDDIPEAEIIDRCRRLERQWAQEEFEIYAKFVDVLDCGQLRLFSGFFGPENHNGILRRWTSPEFSFLIPSNACSFRLSGFASVGKTIQITLLRMRPDESPVELAHYEQPIFPDFLLALSLPVFDDTGPLILFCRVEEHQAEGDHRPLGVLIENASVLLASPPGRDQEEPRIKPLWESSADLADDKEQILRSTFFERWIAVLRDQANARAQKMEDDFAAVRGPHSTDMQSWITRNAGAYDTILVQGIPFDVIPRTVETIRNAGLPPRIVTLPHFHADDRFYHWRRYYDAMAAADATVLFSAAVAEHLKSPGLVHIVPGGGVSLTEHSGLTASTAFRAVYPGREPFFLILGRKTGSKGYERVLAAFEKFRADGHKAHLIMIGPDEDGKLVTGENVHYFGGRPREVVCGALDACVALINMSTSESFGIGLCEAWLFSRPVIANRAQYSFRELVEDGTDGILVGTNAELFAAMKAVVESEDYTRQLSANGFDKVRRFYAWELVTDALYSVLSEFV